METSRYFITRYLYAAGAASRRFPLFGLHASFIFWNFLMRESLANCIIKLTLLHCDVLAWLANLEKIVLDREHIITFFFLFFFCLPTYTLTDLSGLCGSASRFYEDKKKKKKKVWSHSKHFSYSVRNSYFILSELVWLRIKRTTENCNNFRLAFDFQVYFIF